MLMLKIKGFLCVVVFGVVVFCHSQASKCNKSACAKIVTKCQLLQACQCDFKDPHCIRECYDCMGHLYPKCCSCLGMGIDSCPKGPGKDAENLGSQVETFENNGATGLFEALTDYHDQKERWTIETFKVLVNASVPDSNKIEDGPKFREEERNCTVAYISTCLTWRRCQKMCTSMGASGCRWFHDGCCECVGAKCVNHGSNISKCRQCPENKIPTDEDTYDENMSEDDSLHGAEL